jgi:hypothetical protein
MSAITRFIYFSNGANLRELIVEPGFVNYGKYLILLKKSVCLVLPGVYGMTL